MSAERITDQLHKSSMAVQTCLWFSRDEAERSASSTLFTRSQCHNYYFRHNFLRGWGISASSENIYHYIFLLQALDVSDHYPIEFKLKGRGGKTSRYNPHSTTPISFVTNGQTEPPFTFVTNKNTFDGRNGVSGHWKNRALQNTYIYIICLCFISYLQRTGF